MLETDSPYLTPKPFRGQRNEPYMLNFIAEEIAKIKNVSKEEVANITTQTAKDIFWNLIKIYLSKNHGAKILL